MKIGKISVLTSFFIIMGTCQAANEALLTSEKSSRFSLTAMFQGAVNVLFPSLHAEEMQPQSSAPRYSAVQIIEVIQSSDFTKQVYFADHLVIKDGLVTKIRNREEPIIAQVRAQIDLINKNIQKSKSFMGGYVLNYYPEDNLVAFSISAGE